MDLFAKSVCQLEFQFTHISRNCIIFCFYVYNGCFQLSIAHQFIQPFSMTTARISNQLLLKSKINFDSFMHATIIVHFTQSHLCSTTLIGNHPLECAEIWGKKGNHRHQHLSCKSLSHQSRPWPQRN